MPTAAKSPCRQPGCRALVDRAGYCDQHRREANRAHKHIANQDYKERNRFYQRARWHRVRDYHKSIEPMCRHCKYRGKIKAADVVDHIIPLEFGGAEYDENNLQSLCDSCHSAKTQRDKLFWGGRVQTS